MSEHRLELECLNGPWDGHRIEITEESVDWRCTAPGPLAFPWDTELDDPQARLSWKDGVWVLEHLGHRHGTYCVNAEGLKDETRFPLEPGMILKASYIWLKVVTAE